MKIKKIITLLLSVISLTSLHGQSPIESFYKGADISWTTKLEAEGHHFYDWAGKEHECTALMKKLGLNAIRLRVWVTPKERWSTNADLLELAKRAKATNLELMVDFHYSDKWADPSAQHIPENWKNIPYESLKDSLASHTKEVLNLLKRHHITPKWVQVGNETSNGFLWEVGRSSTHMAQYAELTNVGYDAVKEVFPEAIVIVHLNNGFDNTLYNRIFDGLKKYGGKWDMIGMSLYPYWAKIYDNRPDARQVILDCMDNIRQVGKKYKCNVMIVETGMESANPKEGEKQLRLILQEAQNNTNGYCKGVFYWEPECKPSTYALGAFTEDGKPTCIMKAFGE